MSSVEGEPSSSRTSCTVGRESDMVHPSPVLVATSRRLERFDCRFLSLDSANAGIFIVPKAVVVLPHFGLPVNRIAHHITARLPNCRIVTRRRGGGKAWPQTRPVRHPQLHQRFRLLRGDIGNDLPREVAASIMPDGRFDLNHGLTPIS